MRLIAALFFALTIACANVTPPTAVEEQSDAFREERRLVFSSSSREVVIESVPSDSTLCSEIAFAREPIDVGIDLCTQAIENEELSQPILAAVFYNRGYLHFQREDYASAELDFSKAIENNLRPLEKAYYARGLCKQNTGRLREAALDFDQAYKLRPDWKQARERRNEYWWALGLPYPYDDRRD